MSIDNDFFGDPKKMLDIFSIIFVIFHRFTKISLQTGGQRNMSENTDMKFLEEFRLAIDVAGSDPKWASSNPLLDVPKLYLQYAAALAAVEAVPVNFHPHQINVNERQDEYAKVKPMIRKSRGILRSSGATPNEVADGETLINSILGQRAAPKIKDNPDTPENEAANQHSVSQLSYSSQLGNIRSYGVYLGNVTKYTPNETDITPAAFNTFADSLESKNEAVNASFLPYKDALRLRDKLLYDNPDAIYEVAKLMKQYYKAIHEGNPAQYNRITKLKFYRPKRRSP